MFVCFVLAAHGTPSLMTGTRTKTACASKAASWMMSTVLRCQVLCVNDSSVSIQWWTFNFVFPAHIPSKYIFLYIYNTFLMTMQRNHAIHFFILLIRVCSKYLLSLQMGAPRSKRRRLTCSSSLPHPSCTSDTENFLPSRPNTAAAALYMFQ